MRPTQTLYQADAIANLFWDKTIGWSECRLMLLELGAYGIALHGEQSITCTLHGVNYELAPQ